LSVSGPDRLVWLQGLLTNDIAALRTGESRYAAYLTPQGRMISDMRVVQFDDRTLLEVPAVLAEALCAKLDSLLFAEDAQVSDLSASIAVVDVIGPMRNW
jgi:folate-binding Fe-S cluster repair protein YgfZ